MVSQYEVCYEKKRCVTRKVFVVVIPKEGWARMAHVTKRSIGAANRAHPSFGMTTTKTLRSVFS